MFHNVSKVVLRDKRNTFASFSEDELHFSWRTQHFGHFAWQARSTLDVSCCAFFFESCNVRAASSGDNVQIR